MEDFNGPTLDEVKNEISNTYGGSAKTWLDNNNNPPYGISIQWKEYTEIFTYLKEEIEKENME